MDIEQLIKAAYLAGFNASGEGWNGEYPFRDTGDDPEKDGRWIEQRNAALAALAAAPQAQEFEAWALEEFGCGIADETLLERDEHGYTDERVGGASAAWQHLKAAPQAQEPIAYVSSAELEKLADKRIAGRGMMLNKEPGEGLIALYTKPV